MGEEKNNGRHHSKRVPTLISEWTLQHLGIYTFITLVAGAWTERQKMYHGGSFLKLADDNMDIQNPEAQNRDFSGF